MIMINKYLNSKHLYPLSIIARKKLIQFLIVTYWRGDQSMKIVS